MHAAVLARLVLSACLLGACLGALPTRAMELEALLGAPMASSLVRSADGRVLAWVERAAGRRSVFLAAAPDYAAREVYAVAGDAGEPLRGLALSPDGSHLAFSRGGGPNAFGELANPGSEPLGGHYRIELVRAADGATVGAGPGTVHGFSPDGALLLIGREEGLYQLTVAGAFDDDGAEPAPLLTLQGSIGSPAFSPDGGRIAFVSERRSGQALIGVLDLASGAVTWVAPDLWFDQQPAWSPDGSEIAFLRQRPLLIGERLDITAGKPLRLMVAGADGAGLREVWSSGETAAGGLPQRLYGQTVWWPRPDRLLFYSEHDGFLRLYGVDPASGEPAPLTPAGCELQGLDLDPRGGRLAVTHNCGDTDRRDIAAVDLETGALAPLSRGDGIEVSPRLLADGAVAVLASTHARPMTATLLTAGGERRRLGSPLPDAFPADSLQAPTQVIMTAADGLSVHGQLFLPQDAEGRRPAVIFLHGGPVRQMLLGWHYRGYYANAYAMNQYLASRGFVVLSVNYRAGIGYGRDFRLAPETGPRGASEYRDVLAARSYLAGRDDVDAARIGLWGGSYGGNLTALALARNSNLFAAGVDLHGVHDWSLPMPGEPGRYWGLTDADKALARAASPIARIDDWLSPVLLISGDDDRNVVFAETVDLFHRLRDRGVAVEALVLPDEVHGFHRHASWLRAYRAAADFLGRELAPAGGGAP